MRLIETTGEALIDFTVDTTGRVTEAKVINATHPLFGENALEAVKQWRFYPGQKDGHLVSTHRRVPVGFHLEDETVTGVDTVLSIAHTLAERTGQAVLADAADLRLAIAKTPMSPPRMPDGQPLPPDVLLMILLVLDSNGKPQRGHILTSEPAALGPEALRTALNREFKPRVVNGEAIASNVVLIYSTGHPKHPYMRSN